MEDEPDYDIAIAHVSGHPPVPDQRLVSAIQATLRRHEVSQAHISVALVDDRDITRLNQTHLNRQGPTDVLAYDLRDPGDDDSRPSPEARVDGEIVVSLDTAAREAEKRGHDVEMELALYVVHGTLHLLGHDDRNKEDAARMHALEDEILASLKLGPVYRREPQ